MPTKTIRARLVQVDYDTFAYLMALFGLAIGVPVGVLGFFGAVFGKGPQLNVFGSIVEFHGVVAGAMSLVWVPLYYVFCAALLSMLLYFPFRWTLRLVGGIRLRVVPEVRAQPA